MRSSVLPITLTIAGAVLYHLSSKSVPRTVHPLAAILGAYAVAMVACFIVGLGWPDSEGSSFPTVRGFNWSVAGIGLGAAMIEVGFLIAYRAGWPLNAASLFVNVAAALVLIPIGFALFSERVSPGRGLGIVLCVVGLVLLARE
jgi:drug/metabolite transporter (DMT)-like permease